MGGSGRKGPRQWAQLGRVGIPGESRGWRATQFSKDSDYREKGEGGGLGPGLWEIQPL